MTSLEALPKSWEPLYEKATYGEAWPDGLVEDVVRAFLNAALESGVADITQTGRFQDSWGDPDSGPIIITTILHIHMGDTQKMLAGRALIKDKANG